MHMPQCPRPTSIDLLFTSAVRQTSFEAMVDVTVLIEALKALQPQAPQPFTHRVLTGHQGTNMMTFNCSWSQSIAGSCYKASLQPQRCTAPKSKTQSGLTTFLTSLVIRVGGDTIVGNPLVRTLKVRRKRRAHSWSTYNRQWTTRSRLAAGFTN